MTLFTRSALSLLFLLGTPLVHAQAVGAKAITRADLVKNPDAMLKGRRVALLVGISDYKEEITKLPNLNYPVKDMMTVAEALKGQGFTVSLLSESEATATQIRTRLRNLSTLLTKPDESTFLFYFSGHGFAIGKENYLATYGATANNLQQQGLSVAEVHDLLEKSGVRQRLAILDACRNDPEKKSTDVNRSLERFERARGTKILFSTAPGQYSYEDSQLKQGLFTHFLLEGLQGNAAGQDGFISWADLTSYIETKMTDYSASDGNRIQVPYTAGESTGDFLLGRRPANFVAATAKLSPPPTVSPVPAQQPVQQPPPVSTPKTGAAKITERSTTVETKDLWQSAAHPGMHFNFKIDESNIYVYSGRDLLGSLEAKIDRKTKQVKTYEGKVRLAPANRCPEGAGRMVVSDITQNQIKARIEVPKADAKTRKLVCGAWTMGLANLLGPEVSFVKQASK